MYNSAQSTLRDAGRDPSGPRYADPLPLLRHWSLY